METVRFQHGKMPVTLHTHDRPDHLFNHFTQHQAFYELDLLQAAGEVYRRGTWIIDVGANIGNHAIYFARVLGARVLAFEPFPRSREILQANLAANGCSELVTVNPFALGDSPGRGRAHSRSDSNLGMVSVRPDDAGDLSFVRLDDCITLGMDVSILKVDVEGGEMPVLRGAARLLAIDRPHVFAEAAEPAEFESIRAFLAPFGYRPVGRYCATPTYLFSV
jgi:FkbM family methyltransferase